MPIKEQQTSLSKFFKPNPNNGAQNTHADKGPKKRPRSPIDLTLDDDATEAESSIPVANETSKPLNKKPKVQLSRQSGDSSPPSPREPDSSPLHDSPRTTNPKLSASSVSKVSINPLKAEGSTRSEDARRKWALGSTVSEDLTAEDREARATRHAEYATKLSSRFGSRRQRQREIEAESTSTTPPDGDAEEFPNESTANTEMDLDMEDELLDMEETESAIRDTKKNKGSMNKSSKGKGKAKGELGPSGQSWTPLEKQILSLKEQYPGVLLMVEVGYKYRFFGEDARIASKILGIVCFPQRNFLSGSIPVHRKLVHVKRLLSYGHKVGIVGQAETAALKKVSDNRSAPFTRVLTDLYTPATFVDTMNSADDMSLDAASSYQSMICVIEQMGGGLGSDDRVTIGLVSIAPSTGDLVYDEFQDTYMRTELETRLTHIRPCEMLLSGKLSALTRKMLKHFSTIPGREHEEVRMEDFPNQMNYTDAFDYITEFYNEQRATSSSQDDATSRGIAEVVGLPRTVVIALAHTIRHLKAFGLTDAFGDASAFTKFTERSHMLLNGNTLSNLEVYENQTDHSVRGSLLWILDKTKTRFGSRLMRSWIGKPLVDIRLLQERIDAVDEVLNTQSPSLDKLRLLLRGMPDLVRGLARIQYGKSSPAELSIVLEALEHCLNSLALVASEVDYVKPTFVDDDITDIRGGRHPMVEKLRADPFVPNDIFLGGKGLPRHKIITGPNMGGKSSLVRMTALIVVMAQIGSYVPAKSVKIGMHDAVLTRMGAYDELARGRSTFMVEISETSDILKSATPNSLVILDELGRGTSTFDGMSIANAVMRHLVEEIKCKTLFITHYPLVATEIARAYDDVSNGHMGFIEDSRPDGSRVINFLYRLAPGMARNSYGIECAMLAGIPDFILTKARNKSNAMEAMVDERRGRHR
ncbi:hypothetical protein DL93DRAFT_2100103 [Clavulina sp. PMI_390]|nr:hypothetical protein DL93DRAFT_2100103 [Clavulina sp. PMI_390]